MFITHCTRTLDIVDTDTNFVYLKVIFEAERGDDFASDFGLDDINFQKGKCQGITDFMILI